MVGKLHKIDKQNTTIKHTVHLAKPLVIQLQKVICNNTLDNQSNVKNVSFLISGYYVGQSNVIEIGDLIEVRGRKYEISKVTSTPNAMRRGTFNNYFEGN